MAHIVNQDRPSWSLGGGGDGWIVPSHDLSLAIKSPEEKHWNLKHWEENVGATSRTRKRRGGRALVGETRSIVFGKLKSKKTDSAGHPDWACGLEDHIDGIHTCLPPSQSQREWGLGGGG